MLSLFWWAHVSPEKKDLILFSIKRHWMNCFLCFFLGPDILCFQPTFVWDKSSDECIRISRKQQKLWFIYMHIHRVLCYDREHIAFEIVMAFWYLCNPYDGQEVDESHAVCKEIRHKKTHRTMCRNFSSNLNSIEYSLTVFVDACRAGCCNKCVHSKLWLKGCFCVIKMHNKKARKHEKGGDKLKI